MADQPRQFARYKPEPLPEGREPIDLSVGQVMAYRGESARKVFAKCRSGAYVSYRSGGKRLIVFASVKANRELELARGAQFAPKGVKRTRGRPKKTEQAAAEA